MITFDENLDANSVPNRTLSSKSRSRGLQISPRPEFPGIQRPEKVDGDGRHGRADVAARSMRWMRLTRCAFATTAPGQIHRAMQRVPITRKALQDSEGNLVEKKWPIVVATNVVCNQRDAALGSWS